MNITGSGTIAPIERGSASAGSLSQATSEEPSAGAAALFARTTIDSTRRATASGRERKLATLESQVRERSYRPDANSIAREIVADTDTRLGLRSLIAH